MFWFHTATLGFFYFSSLKFWLQITSLGPSPGLTPENNLDLWTSLLLPGRNGVLLCEGKDEEGWRFAQGVQAAGKAQVSQGLWDQHLSFLKPHLEQQDWEGMKELIGNHWLVPIGHHRAAVADHLNRPIWSSSISNSIHKSQVIKKYVGQTLFSTGPWGTFCPGFSRTARPAMF